MSYELVRRAQEALHALSMLNETPVSNGFDAVSKSAERAYAPRETDTALDYFTRRLERWCKDAEARVESERKGQADTDGQVPELSMEQKRWRLLHSGSFEGRRAQTAARLLDVEVEYVWKWRTQLGRDEQTGRSK